MASVFTARVCRGKPAAAPALVPKVLNESEDLDAAPAQSAGARVQNAAVPGQSVAAPAPTVAVPAQNVGAVDHYAVPAQNVGAGDHYAVPVHNAAVFPHVARAQSGKVVAHYCAQVDPDVARGSRFAPVVPVAQIARDDPFPPAAGSFPGEPDVHFFPGDLFFRIAPDVPRGFRFPRPAVWWGRLTVVALAAPNR